MSIKSHIRDLGKRAVSHISSALDWMFGNRVEEKIGILVYHRIAHHPRGLRCPSMNVTPRRFRDQIVGLLNQGIEIWPLQRILDAHEQQHEMPRKVAAITFDDGFESVYTGAWPTLSELNVPATIFLSTAYLDRSEPFPFDDWGREHQRRAPSTSYRPLTSVQCAEMMSSGLVELGSHTHTHQDFRNRPLDLQRDVEISIEILRQRFSITNCTFAFPFGRIRYGYAGGELSDVIRNSKARCALTTEATLVDLRSDPFSWGRFNAYQWDNSTSIQSRLHGWYSWGPGLQEWLLP